MLAKTVLAASTALFPVPAVMISCATPAGEKDIVTVAWVGTICSDPPMVAIGLRPSRHSHRIITESREFVVNIPSADQTVAMDYCGLVSGKDHDKFADCGFSATVSSQLKYAPLIAECPVNLECQVQQVLSLGSHDLLIAQVVAVQAEETLVNANRIDHVTAQPVCYAGGTYYGLGELIAKGGVGRQIKERQG